MDGGRDPRIWVGLDRLAQLGVRARNIDFLPRQPVGSALSGRRASRLRGRGLEFEEIRAYLPGDDIRNMDWRVTARTGNPHVRVTREERDRPALILVDQRQAMFFGSRLNMKSVTAAEFAALTAWRILGAGDRVGGMVITETGTAFVKARRSRASVLQFLSLVAESNDALSAITPSSAEAPGLLNQAIAKAAQIVSHDWLLLIVSDFDGADDETFRILTGIARGNDLVLAAVSDPLAHELPAQGRLVAGDGRLQVELDLTEARARRNLTEVGGERLKRLLSWQDRLDAAILPLDSGEPTEPQVLRLLGGRSGGIRR
ncbi:MAG: DUF58 domain-containing protein [Cereibacter sphaeroides]|uniref:DUF58 domain-containing protein n=1 Tax=Cereibacter sphaeroides TaxID=1063 RepID=A0A2W5SDS6_CERSP|nr:MAG: DUF58 domain-containing protein [Cereibacter sphaeroides]